MINLGNDYDSISTLHAGEFAKLPAGGYVCIVKNAVVNSNKNNKPMLVLDFDIAEGEFKGLFQNAQYPPKLYQNIEDQNGKTSPFLKGVLTDFEESNSGLHIKGGMFDERSLINKFIGVIFGIEEREYNDKIYSDAKPFRTTTVAKIRSGDFKIPEPKKIDKPPSKPSNDDDGFVTEEIPDESVPF